MQGGAAGNWPPLYREEEAGQTITPVLGQPAPAPAPTPAPAPAPTPAPAPAPAPAHLPRRLIYSPIFSDDNTFQLTKAVCAGIAAGFRALVSETVRKQLMTTVDN